MCGDTVPAEEAVRMRVHTGTSVGRGGARGYYGMRTLCGSCAEGQRNRNVFWNVAALLFVLGLVVFYFVLH
jgi:hypothetical protein